MAPYITAADLRPDTLTEYTWGLDISTSDVPLNSVITAAIARQSDRLDRWTNDHFAPETAATYVIDGLGGTRLYLPRRLRTLTSVSTIDQDGNTTAQVSTAFRTHASLNASGDTRLFSGGDLDWVEVIPGQLLNNVAIFPPGYYYDASIPDGMATGSWPKGPGTISVLGDWSWATTPAEIKRAIALMVYFQLNPQADVLRVATQFSDGGATYQIGALDDDHPSGLPEADEIIRYFRRAMPPSF